MKMVLFDIDGTLLLTGGVGKIAFCRAFEKLFGVYEVWRDIVPDGKTDPVIIAEIVERNLTGPLSPEQYEEVVGLYLVFFDEEIRRAERFRLMPGVPELLRALEGLPHVHVGLATGNFERAAHMKLARGDINHFFKFGGYGSDSPVRRDLTQTAIRRGEAFIGSRLRPSEICLVGDTPFDIEVGQALGLSTVAVATGSTDRKRLAAMNPEYILDTLEDVDQFLKILE